MDLRIPGGTLTDKDVEDRQGIEVLRGSAADRVPVEAIRAVASQHSAHLLVDLRRAGIEPPPDNVAGTDLLARLPESLRGG